MKDDVEVAQVVDECVYQFADVIGKTDKFDRNELAIAIDRSDNVPKCVLMFFVKDSLEKRSGTYCDISFDVDKFVYSDANVYGELTLSAPQLFASYPLHS